MMVENSPAIVQVACSLKDRAARLKAMRLTHLQYLRVSLVQSRDLGRELTEAKDQCTAENKGWYEWLEEAGWNPESARRYMLLAQYWTEIEEHPTLSSESTITDALSLIKEITDKKTTGAAASTTLKQCRPCRVGTPKPGCKDCAAMNKPAGKRGPRQPGEGTRGSKPKPGGNGKPLFQWHEFNKSFGQIIRQIDLFGKTYHAKEDPRVEALRVRIKQLKDEMTTLEKAFQHA